MNRISLNARLWLVLTLMWAGLLLLGGWGALHERETMLRDRKADLRDIVESAEGIVKNYASLAASGAMTTEAAQKEAMARLSEMRYGQEGYMFIIDSRPVMLMNANPANAGLKNKNVGDGKDSNGKLFFSEMVKEAHAQNKGFVEYQGLVVGTHTRAPKITYFEYYEPWDWIVATGLYVQDINELFYASLLTNLVVLGVIGTVVTVAMLLIIRTIKRNLGGEPAYAVEIANGIANHDLQATVRLRAGDDESLLSAIAMMQKSLSQVISGIRSGAESISAAAQQIASGNMDLSSRTEQQAASLQETAASMEELTGTVKHNADNASQAMVLAGKASDTAARGVEVVSRVVSTMGDISASSDKIADIIGVIDGIAFQTNILALNAAVEAARAGEQGRGFAVVAGEVRTLAQRSAAAAKEIKALIDNSASKVQSGSELVSQAGTTMQEIMKSVKQVVDIMGEIAVASDEQSHGIEQVNRAVSQMDTATQQNAALVEQVAAAAQSLQEQATILARAVGQFKVNRAGNVGDFGSWL
ncbi:methyl-accepting chemotaxis protein [Burkholderia sp. PU8-34]